jgi:uncharacterized protein YkwD
MTTSRSALAFGLVTAACALPSPASAVTEQPDGLVQVAQDVSGLAEEAMASLDVATASADPMVAKINRVRRRNGLRRLRVSRRLTSSSRRFGAHLMRANRFGHDSHIWGGGRYRRVGEVLSLHHGWRSRRASTVRGWMHSASHRAVLLGRFRMVGVARVAGHFGRSRATIWVAQVAR